MLGDRDGVEAWLEGMDGCTLIRGHARFDGSAHVGVDDELLQADRIFLNVGGRAVVPDIPGLADVDYLTNVGILELDTVPEHLVIIGGSYIALEFAQMYRRFGAAGHRGREGTAADLPRGRGRLGRHPGDPGARGHRRRPRRRRHADRQARQRFRADAARRCRPDRGQPPAAGDGAGPTPTTSAWRWPACETDARGYIVVDDQLRTNVEHIWAMGDCNGKGAFTHTSYNDFEIVAANLLDDEPRRVSDRIPTYALYIDPPLGRAGMTVDRGAQVGPKGVGGQAADDAGRPRGRKG